MYHVLKSAITGHKDNSMPNRSTVLHFLLIIALAAILIPIQALADPLTVVANVTTTGAVNQTGPPNRYSPVGGSVEGTITVSLPPDYDLDSLSPPVILIVDLNLVVGAESIGNMESETWVIWIKTDEGVLDPGPWEFGPETVSAEALTLYGEPGSKTPVSLTASVNWQLGESVVTGEEPLPGGGTRTNYEFRTIDEGQTIYDPKTVYAVAAPEPATFTLLGCSLPVLLWLRRRRK